MTASRWFESVMEQHIGVLTPGNPCQVCSPRVLDAFRWKGLHVLVRPRPPLDDQQAALAGVIADAKAELAGADLSPRTLDRYAAVRRMEQELDLVLGPFRLYTDDTPVVVNNTRIAATDERIWLHHVALSVLIGSDVLSVLLTPPNSIFTELTLLPSNQAPLEMRIYWLGDKLSTR